MISKTLAVGTYNGSVKAIKHDKYGVQEALANWFEFYPYAVLGGQEWGQAHWLESWLYELGVKVYFGDTDASAATPIMYKGVTPDVFKSRILTGRTHVGDKPAGPTWTKDKYLNEIRFPFNGRLVHVVNRHDSPSIWWPPNRRLNRLQVERTAEYLDPYKTLVFATADSNKNPNHKFNQPLYRIGLESAQLLRGPMATEKKRAIDDVCANWDDDRMELAYVRTTKTPGDHRIFTAVSHIYNP